ncbi:aldehyde dehydrogenase family protein [archaeon]|nr:MAG: aldehyde dehydrogenase family protein [archaeon]
MLRLYSKSLLAGARLGRQMSSVPVVPNFIDGRFEQSKTTKFIDVVNPATQELVCRVPESTDEELKRAEAGAKKAFQAWRDVPVQQRQVCQGTP